MYHFLKVLTSLPLQVLFKEHLLITSSPEAYVTYVDKVCKLNSRLCEVSG